MDMGRVWGGGCMGMVLGEEKVGSVEDAGGGG